MTVIFRDKYTIKYYTETPIKGSLLDFYEQVFVLFD